MRLAPLDFGLRVQAGELLVALGDHGRGVRVLRSAADYFTLSGFPLKALWALKLLELHGADNHVVQRGMNLLAEHYAGEEDREWGDPIFESPLPKMPGSLDMSVLPEDFDDVVAEVDRRATDMVRSVIFPDRLPRFPLLSELEREAFLTVVADAHLKRLPSGSVLVQEGEPGEAVELLVNGKARVQRSEPGGGPVVLAELTEGAIFGEMSLVTESPRVASVVAEGPVDVVEIHKDVLGRLGKEAAALQRALSRQVCDRMLHNLMNLSPVFQVLPEDRRGQLLSRFRSRLVEPEEDIIRQGEEGPGLFVVLDGLIQVTVAREDSNWALNWLREGDIFGEISLVKRMEATATCTATRRSLLMFLPREEFEDIMRDYPEVAERISQLGEYRLIDTYYTLA